MHQWFCRITNYVNKLHFFLKFRVMSSTLNFCFHDQINFVDFIEIKHIQMSLCSTMIVIVFLNFLLKFQAMSSISIFVFTIKLISLILSRFDIFQRVCVLRWSLLSFFHDEIRSVSRLFDKNCAISIIIVANFLVQWQ